MGDRFQTIFDSLAEQVLVVDRDLRITYANPAWIGRVGLTASQVFGRPCHQVLASMDMPCVKELCAAQQVFQTGKPLHWRCQGHEQQNGEQETRLSASPIFDAQGQVVEAALVAQPSSAPAGQDTLEAIRQLGLVLTSSLELQEVLERILQSTLGLLSEAQDAHIYLYEQDRLSFGAALWADGRRGTPWSEPHPRGLTYTVARQGKLVVVTDIRTHPFLAYAPPHWEGSVVGLPLKIGQRVVGVMSIAYPKPHAPSETELRTLRLLADQAAMAIENARLYQEVSHHLQEVQILNDVARATISTLDFSEVIRRGLTALLGQRSFERVNILLLDEAKKELWLHPALAGSDLFPRRAKNRIPLGKGITGWVAESGEPLRVPDVRQEPRYIAGYADMLSELCVPLRVGERIIGVLDVQSTQLDAFSEDDERLLTTLSSQFSTVIENSRLFAEAQKRVHELTSLMQVSQALNEAKGLDTILNIVFDQVFNLLGSQEGSIILVDPPNSNRLRIVAERGLGPEVVEAFNNRPVYTHEGTYRRALSTGQLVLVADTSSDPDFLRDVGSRAKQVTNVPLVTDRGAIGLIAVDGLPKDDTSRRLLTILAGIAAVAIDKERLLQETAARLSEVSTLYTLSTQITSSLSTNAVLESIVGILRMTLDCRACSIFLIDPTEGYLQLETASGPSEAWKGIARLRIGEGISGRVIAERRSIYIPDTQQEPDFIFFDPQIRSLLVVPLIVRGQAIGTLSIDDTQPNAFDEEVRLLTIAAAQAAVAIENAQLYESLQTSYKELEHAFDELRHLDKMKSELIQNISHELRTPLTFIRGYIELLQDGEMGDLLPEQKAAVSIVAGKAEALSRLVDDIISMLQVGREQFRTAPVCLASVGHAAIEAARASAMDAGLSLTSEIPEELPLVLGDERRLGQVLDNLLQNAIKFTSPGGSITVRMRDEGSHIRTEVQDTGIGIPADQLSRIFDRFYQVDGTTTRRFGGTGLGLAIVKQIVETHGGQVGVASEVDKGSIFHFTVPTAEIWQV